MPDGCWGYDLSAPFLSEGGLAWGRPHARPHQFRLPVGAVLGGEVLDVRTVQDSTFSQLLPDLRATKSISTSALRANPLTPTQVRAGCRSALK